MALNLFLRFRYTPSPLTIFKGIRKLAPGDDAGYRERRMPRRTLVQLHAGTPFSNRLEDRKKPTENCSNLYRGCGQTASAQRRAGRNTSKRRARFGLAFGAHERTGWSVAGIYDRLWQSFEDDELADAAETAAFWAHGTCTVKLDQAEFERSLPTYRGMFGRTNCNFLDCANVLRLTASAARRQGGVDWSGAGRNVRRLQTAPGCPLRKLVARVAGRTALDGLVSP